MICKKHKLETRSSKLLSPTPILPIPSRCLYISLSRSPKTAALANMSIFSVFVSCSNCHEPQDVDVKIETSHAREASDALGPDVNVRVNNLGLIERAIKVEFSQAPLLVVVLFV